MQILGHRGARYVHQDNTREAIDFALRSGADGIEVDLRWDPRIHEIVLSHDPIDSDKSYLKLTDAMQTIRAFKGQCQLEVKPASEQDFHRIIAQLNQMSIPERCIITSFSTHLLSILPATYHRALITSHPTRSTPIIARKLGCKFIGVETTVLTTSLIKQANRMGMKIYVWTENSIKRARIWQKKKVDAVITDRPHLMRTYAFKRSIRPKPSSAAAR